MTSRAFRGGWSAVIATTVKLDSSNCISRRYTKLMAADGKEPIGGGNIELISDRKFETWLDEQRGFREAVACFWRDECSGVRSD